MLKVLANLLTAKDNKPKLIEKPRVYIEYTQGHWAIQIRNPGQQSWQYLLETSKLVNLYNDFGDQIGTKPSIQSFESHNAALAWVNQNVPEAVFEKKRTSMAEAYTHGNSQGLTTNGK